MSGGEVVVLRAGPARALVRPAEGGVVESLTLGALSVLARTPWADAVVASASPADTEAEWVSRWRGGWQLCFPTAGEAERGADPPQGFHGAASQAPWRLVHRTARACVLEWWDAGGLRARRRWRVHRDGLTASTTVTNDGPDRRIAVAEHLILGGDLLAALPRGGDLDIAPAGDAAIAGLDYSGAPTGEPAPWPAGDWDRATAATPPRVAAAVHPRPRRIRVASPVGVATVSWRGLEHALIWEEFARSQEPPWNGGVLALGVEPTTTPHGAGTAHPTGAPILRTDRRIHWTTRLRVTAPRGEDPR